ncbi:MFS transporter [Fulvitalea axinellae]|uniref:MFS transporter n=1 Tax=Fulvitalea axinellae TaxID=1182444 RepID=A0AAU9CK55_9BACT|nr:MFS transporter [Fulvitalea axinellae]
MTQQHSAILSESLDGNELSLTPNPNRALGKTALWGSFFFERLMYYGIRSILILFLLNVKNITTEESQIGYGLLFSLVAVGYIIMGPLTDKYLKQKNAVLIGFALCLAGLLIAHLSTSNILFWGGLGLICLGSPAIDLNLYVLTGRLYSKADPKRHSAFYAMTLVSFLSSFIMGGFATYLYMARPANILLMLSVLPLTGLVFFFILRKDIKEIELKDEKNAKNSGTDSPASTKGWQKTVFFLALSAFVLVWASKGFNVSAVSLAFDLSNFSTAIPATMLFSSGTAFLSLTACIIMLAITAKLNAHRLPNFMSWSFAILAGAGLCWFVASEILTSAFPLVLLGLAMGTVAEVMLRPMLYSHITRISPTRWSSTAFGIAKGYMLLISNALTAVEYEGIVFGVALAVVIGVTWFFIARKPELFGRLFKGVE